ncbi:hypothetical protein LWI29_029291 [Acer saccharum]|uniref:Uncharacterized protein n=1 Tax=Acer saccharum TaxID=4024 RepID=A0AA39S3F8_ACESA|nr:hypothetical protein LWI29_029291 [Acer saccharum]
MMRLFLSVYGIGCRVEIIKEADEEEFEGEEGDEEVYRNSLGKNWHSPVNELMQGGVSWIASNVYVTYKGLQSLETYLSSRASSPDGNSYFDLQENLHQFLVSKFPFIMMLFLLILIIFFLFTSIELPITANSIRLRTGNFSVRLGLAIFASLMLPPTFFLFSYLLLIIISPCYGFLWSLLKHLFNSLRQTLLSLPTIVIVFFTQNQQNPQQLPAPQAGEETGSLEREEDVEVVIHG